MTRMGMRLFWKRKRDKIGLKMLILNYFMENQFDKMLSEVSKGYEPTPLEREMLYISLLEKSKKTLDDASDLMESTKLILSGPVTESDFSTAIKNYNKSVEMIAYMIDDWKAMETYASKLFPIDIENPELLAGSKIDFYQNCMLKTEENILRLEKAALRNRRK
jgi:hypothetical protein